MCPHQRGSIIIFVWLAAAVPLCFQVFQADTTAIAARTAAATIHHRHREQQQHRSSSEETCSCKASSSVADKPVNTFQETTGNASCSASTIRSECDVISIHTHITLWRCSLQISKPLVNAVHAETFILLLCFVLRAVHTQSLPQTVTKCHTPPHTISQKPHHHVAPP